MPVIRIDPAPKRGKKRIAAQTVGTIIGKAFGGPGLVLFGAKMGDSFGKLISKKEPVFPVEVDTETNVLRLLAPDPKASINTKTRVLAPRIDKLNNQVQSALQEVWNTGQIVGQLPKRYRDLASELLSQRAILYRDTQPPAVSPTITEGAQYTGEYSMAGIVPPGGFAGFAQMTPASKAAQGFGKLLKSVRGATRRKKRKSKAGGKRKRKASGRKGKKLVKGSAAAKRFMAALRRKRK